MKIVKAKDYQDLSRKAANIIAAQLIAKPDCVLGLATGSSPIGTYDRLVSMYESGDLDFSRVTTVNLETYKGLDFSNDQSYRYFMNQHLFISLLQCSHGAHLCAGRNDRSSDAACAAYNELLHKVGPADLQLLGLGHDGHIGFNEPDRLFPQ